MASNDKRNVRVLELLEYNYSREHAEAGDSVGSVNLWGKVLAISAAGIVVLTGWSYTTRPAGDRRSDDEAKSAGNCLDAYPIGRIGDCGGWEVVEDVRIDTGTPPNLLKPDRELVLRIHVESLSAGFVTDDPALTACYRYSFNHYGLAGGPTRVHCP
jgi:hypothetical protein